jgi:hypothetical protein
MYIALPVMMVECISDEEENLGIAKEQEPEELIIYINSNHIVSHWKGFDDYTHITLSDTIQHISPIDHKEFIKLLEECVVSVELTVNDN